MRNLYKHSNVFELLSRDLKENMLNHGYMLISNDEDYVKALAQQMAMQILCADHTPCYKCSQCIKVEKNEHADVMVVPSIKKNIVVEDIERIVNESYILPLEGEKKIYILNNFDQATVQAQNKILKTLEEPPKSVVFIITTTNENNVLATIKSRCKKVVVPLIKDELLEAYLKAEYQDSQAISKVLTFADGNLTTAKRFLSGEKTMRIKDVCVDIVNKLDKSDKVLHYSSIIQEFSDNIEDFLNILLDTVKEVGEDIVFGNETRYNVHKYNLKIIVEISKVIQTALMKVRANCNINAVLDYLLLGILEVKFKCQK